MPNTTPASCALGWPGPWREAAQHGLDGLVARYRRPDGLYRTLVAPDGDALDETAMLYDQAFVLLALATGRTVRPVRYSIRVTRERAILVLKSRIGPISGNPSSSNTSCIQREGYDL